MFSALSHATAKLKASAQWKARTNGSQTRIIGRRRRSSRSVLAGFGVVELLERLGVVGHVGALAALVGRVDLVAAAFDLDLAHFVTVRLQLGFESGLGLPLRLRRARAFAFGEGGAGGGDSEDREGAKQLHQGLRFFDGENVRRRMRLRT